MMKMQANMFSRELKAIADEIPNYVPSRRKLSPKQVKWLLQYYGFMEDVV